MQIRTVIISSYNIKLRIPVEEQKKQALYNRKERRELLVQGGENRVPELIW